MSLLSQMNPIPGGFQCHFKCKSHKQAFKKMWKVLLYGTVLGASVQVLAAGSAGVPCGEERPGLHCAGHRQFQPAQTDPPQGTAESPNQNGDAFGNIFKKGQKMPGSKRRKGKKVKNNRGSIKVREGGGVPWHQSRYSCSPWRTHDGANFFLKNCSLCKSPLQRREKCERERAANYNHNLLSPVYLCHAVWVRGVRKEVGHRKEGREINKDGLMPVFVSYYQNLF